MTASYDQAYRVHSDYFGQDPEPLLEEHGQLIDRARPVLDVGAGQGRNALYLARQGLTVHAIDPSRVAVESMRSLAVDQSVQLTAWPSGFQDFEADPGSYACVLLFGILQELDRDSIRMLIEQVHSWCHGDALVFVTAHATGDPTYAYWARRTEIGSHSFKHADGRIRTFLEPGEILTLFEGFQVLSHREGLGPVHRHGDGPPQQHAEIKAIFRPS